MADNTNIDTTNTTQEAPKTEPTPSVEDLAKQIKELQTQLAKQKKATDSASSDAASWKDKYRSTLTEAQQAEAARAEAEKALREAAEIVVQAKSEDPSFSPAIEAVLNKYILDTILGEHRADRKSTGENA